MRRWIALAALLTLAAIAPPGAPATGKPITVDASGAGSIPVDLVDNATSDLVFRVRESNFTAPANAGPLQSAYVSLAHAGEPAIELAMAEDPDGMWSVAMPVSSPDFITGTWQVKFNGLRNGGSSPLGAGRSLDATARDTLAPQLTLLHPPAALPVVVGAGQTVELSAKDALLRKVTFEHSGLLPTALPAPYVFPGDALPEGRTPVAFTAYDRNGHKTVLNVDIVRDTVAPTVNLTLPVHVYSGVPFLAYARVTETGPYTLRFAVNGTAQPDVAVPGSVAAGVNRTTAFTVTPNATGNLSLAIEAIDQVGARALAAAIPVAEVPITNLRLSGLAVEPAGAQFAQRSVRFSATLEQADGVTALAVPVTLTVGGQSVSRIEDVAATGPRTLSWEVHLPGGRYTALAAATVPEGANETAPGDENDTVDLEVFLGRVLDNGTAYDIRAGDNGLPSAAVEEGKDKAYSLKLADSGKGVVYRFTVEGNRTVSWDPLDPLAQQAPGGSTTSSSSSGSSTKGSKPASAAGPLVALLVVALAALAQRRRL